MAVTTHALSAGEVVQPTDVQLRAFPTDLLPDGCLSSLDAVVDRVLTSDLTAGTVITEAVILGGDASSRHLAAFRVADAQMAALLHVGDAITVIATSPDGSARTIATSVRVSALPAGDPSLMSTHGGALVVVSTDAATAQEISAAAAMMPLTYTMG